MPNHVHVLVRPFSDALAPLEHIEQGWKANTARAIHLVRGTAGRLWQRESFDRIVRDEEHLWRCLQYIGDNPRRASVPTEFNGQPKVELGLVRSGAADYVAR